MTPQEFDYIRDLLKERSGLVLGDEKRYLIESRLTPVAREEGMESLSDLVTGLKGAGSEALRTKVTQAMTINESFFFRDKTPFENFKDIIVPAMLASPRSTSRTMRIWCAAASTGQEPYSLAIQIKELDDQLRGWNIEIVATDLSEEVLEKAKSGLYSQFEVQRGLPIQLMVKYFKQTGSLWQIDSSIRSMVKYQHFNLLDDYTPLGTFDVIFCRNVLIYFDPPTKSDMLGRMARRLRSDGFLALGAAETVIGISDDFMTVTGARGLYALQESAGTAASPPARVSAAATAATPISAVAQPVAPAAAPATSSPAKPMASGPRPAVAPAAAISASARPAPPVAAPAASTAPAPAVRPAPLGSAPALRPAVSVAPAPQAPAPQAPAPAGGIASRPV